MPILTLIRTGKKTRTQTIIVQATPSDRVQPATPVILHQAMMTHLQEHFQANLKVHAQLQQVRIPHPKYRTETAERQEHSPTEYLRGAWRHFKMLIRRHPITTCQAPVQVVQCMADPSQSNIPKRSQTAQTRRRSSPRILPLKKTRAPRLLIPTCPGAHLSLAAIKRGLASPIRHQRLVVAQKQQMQRS